MVYFYPIKITPMPLFIYGYDKVIQGLYRVI